MKYFIFPRGTMKLDGIELESVVLGSMAIKCREVSRLEYFKTVSTANSIIAMGNAKHAYAVTKQKAIDIRDAIKK